jgi:uncharacterized protein
MNTSESPVLIARRLVAAVMAKDADAMRQLYVPGAPIWHNFDGKEQTVDDNIRGMFWIHKQLSNVVYDVQRLVEIPGGFLQEHVLRGTLASGEAFAMPACVVCMVENGRITSLREYLDSAHTVPLTSQGGKGRAAGK